MWSRDLWKILPVSLIAGIVFHANLVLAGIGVAPTITELEVAPGGVKTGFFRVANSGEETVLVKVELEDWLRVRVGKSPVDVDTWLVMDETEFELEPVEVKNIGYEILAPEGIEGELMAMVFFSSSVPGGGSLSITSRFGVAVYIGIEGTEIVEAEIKDIRLNDSSLAIAIENKGNVHLRPYGRVAIRDNEGNLIHEAGIPYSAVIFAGKSHVYPLDLGDKRLSRGEYKIEALFDTGEIYEKNKTFTKTVSVYVE